MLTKNNVENIISKTLKRELQWIKSENLDCFDCQTEDYGVIVCRFKDKGEAAISVYFTDDWGNIYAEKEFKRSVEDATFFDKLSQFYDVIEKDAVIEYI